MPTEGESGKLTNLGGRVNPIFLGVGIACGVLVISSVAPWWANIIFVLLGLWYLTHSEL